MLENVGQFWKSFGTFWKMLENVGKCWKQFKMLENFVCFLNILKIFGFFFEKNQKIFQNFGNLTKT